MPRLFTSVASLIAEGGMKSMQASVVVVPRLLITGSIIVVYLQSCFSTCGIFPDQGMNPCLLHWQMDSLPMSHQGKPVLNLKDGNSYKVSIFQSVHKFSFSLRNVFWFV